MSYRGNTIQFSRDGWRSDAPLGEWEGVTTDSNGRVTELAIPLGRDRQWIPIPWELGNLANLEVLRIYFDDGGIKGGIPPEWGNLTNLKVLRITTGRASSEPSTLPPLLRGFTNLEELCISGMSIWEIPAELGNLANLEVLCLSDVTGEIPAELGNLANLEMLRLSGDLSGEIPAELGNLANLQSLVLYGGDLSGCIPLELRGSEILSSSDLDFCADPRVVAEQMPVLAALYDATGGDDWYDNTNWLSDADLGEWYGVTTDGEGYITGLKLYENDLSGEIPAELGQLARLQSLYLYGNSLTGCIPANLEDQLTDTELGGLSYCGR